MFYIHYIKSLRCILPSFKNVVLIRSLWRYELNSIPSFMMAVLGSLSLIQATITKCSSQQQHTTIQVPRLLAFFSNFPDGPGCLISSRTRSWALLGQARCSALDPATRLDASSRFNESNQIAYPPKGRSHHR